MPLVQTCYTQTVHRIFLRGGTGMTGENKVLCVEDDADTCELIAAILYDYNVLSARSVHDAIDLLEKESFNYVILDMFLPDGSGLELCKQIRSADEATPIVFVTGSQTLNLRTVAKPAATNSSTRPRPISSTASSPASNTSASPTNIKFSSSDLHTGRIRPISGSQRRARSERGAKGPHL